MKVLLNGVLWDKQGMIGSRLLSFLEEKGVEVVTFTGDIRDKQSWVKYEGQGITHVIHLAGLAGVRESFDNPELYEDTNVNGTKLAMQFCYEFDAKLLYASTSNVYEWWVNPYAYSKRTCEHLADVFPIESIGMRFHTVWPGRDDMLFKLIQNGELGYINENHTRDFIHVDDLCSGIYTILTNFDTVKDKKFVDIGTGEAVKTIDVFNNHWDTVKYTHEVKRLTNVNEGERVHTQANIDYLLDLGWKPERNII